MLMHPMAGYAGTTQTLHYDASMHNNAGLISNDFSPLAECFDGIYSHIWFVSDDRQSPTIFRPDPMPADYVRGGLGTLSSECDIWT